MITDRLEVTNSDLKTFSFGPIAFGNQLISPPPFQANFSTTVDLRPSNNLLVAVSASLDSGTGVVTWSFESLDPTTNQPPTDPTAGFLPPGGEGSVVFTVLPEQELPTNTQIQNQAAIVFDVDPPISTETWLNTLDNDKPTSHTLPLPTTENSASFTVQWSGTDVGAGIQDFTIYVSDNGGPFTAWLLNTTETSASYPGVDGHTYGFFSQARDLVGNVEALKTQAEATTTVRTGGPPTPDCSTATASVNFPRLGNRHRYKVNILGVTDPQGDKIDITINSIFQDEPVTSATGKTCPDGIGVGTDVAKVRNERIITQAGDGRVYHLSFTAMNSSGAACTKEVTVCVPKTQGGGCVDEGPLFDSTICP